MQYGSAKTILADTTKKILIENANKQIIDNTTTPSTQYFKGDVRAFHSGSFFYCDSAKMVGNQLFAYGNVVIIQNDTVSIFGDELFYDGDSLLAFIKSKVVLVNDKDNLFTEYLEYDLRTKKAYYRDKALLKSEKSELKSKKGTYDVANNMVHFEERVTVEGEDFYMVTDTLDFDTKKEIAIWNSPAVIDQDSAKIYSKSGTYDIKNKKAEFNGNAQYVKKDVIAKGDKMTYDGKTKDVGLFGKASYFSAQDTALADSIKYNEPSDIVQLVGNATFKNKTNNAKGKSIVYNKKDDNFKLSGRGQIQDSTAFLDADDIDYSKITKIGKATGTVIYRDTAARTSIECDSLDLNGNEDFFLARNKKGKPLLSTEVDGDTMFISSFIIKQQRIITPIDSITSDTTKALIAHKDVKIFKGDLQGKADSLVYSTTDSIITMINNPILWTDSTQLSGDTIKLFIKNKKIDVLEMDENALVLSSSDMVYFNQIRGKKITGMFKDKALDKMKVNGNAQSIYYMLDDDDAYIGVKQTDCSSFIMQFENKKVKNIRFYTDPKSILTPIDKAKHEEIKLKGFKWLFNSRPKSLEELKI